MNGLMLYYRRFVLIGHLNDSGDTNHIINHSGILLDGL